MSGDHERRHLDEAELTAYALDGEAAYEGAVARRHLAGCAACREQLEEIRATLELVAGTPPPPAPEGFERVIWARVSAELEAARPAWWQTWWRAPRLAIAAGAVVLVAAAFVAGRWSRPAADPPPAEVLVTLSPETARRLATEDHLERAQMVLAEVLHADADDPDLEAERVRAADLVAVNRLIRLSSAGPPDAAADVLADLERILVEFVNRADRWSPEELASFKARLDEGGLLFRLRVVSAEMRRRPERPAPPIT